MGIHLTALTPAQVTEVIDLAKSKAAKVARKKIKKPEDLLLNNIKIPELQQLVTVIDRLHPTAKSELMTLVWLGMGTIDDDQISWDELLHAAQDIRMNDVPEQLALMARLHEYLHRGLDKVG